MKRSVFIAAMIGGLALIGCEAPPAPSEPADAFAAPGGSSTSATGLNSTDLRHLLTGNDNGLEVRRLIVTDRADVVVRAIGAHADGQAVSDDALARLKRNGLRLARIPADHIESLIADLGGASYDANEWHGQAHEWRSLLDRPIEEAGRAVAVDGLVRRYERGDFRLMIRAWTVQMEDGRFMHLEMVPRRRAPKTNDLRRLLSEKALGGDGGGEQAFASMALDLQLQAGFAYVLLCESPKIDWPELNSVAATESSKAGATPAAPADNRHPPAASSSSRTGPFDDWQPAAPLTLGEFLLSVKREPPARGILIFVPKIPAELSSN